MKVSVIFLIFAILCFGTHANPVQSTSEIDSNVQDSSSRVSRALPVKETDSVGSGSLLDLGVDVADSVLLPLHHITKRGLWSYLGRNIGRGFRTVGSGLWKGMKAVGNAAFFNRYGYMPNQAAYRAPPPAQPSYGEPPSSSEESEMDMSMEDSGPGGDYMYH